MCPTSKALRPVIGGPDRSSVAPVRSDRGTTRTPSASTGPWRASTSAKAAAAAIGRSTAETTDDRDEINRFVGGGASVFGGVRRDLEGHSDFWISM